MEDFPSTSRRHVAGPQPQLGPGLAPQAEQRVVPVALARPRVAHDTAEMAEDPHSFVATVAREAADPSGSGMMSTYQAMASGAGTEAKRRTGKKIVQPQAQQGAARGGLAFGGGAGLRVEPEAALLLGTTKQSPHIPGYCGHIPKTATAADPTPARSIDKTLIVENYKPYGAGYTGRKG